MENVLFHICQNVKQSRPGKQIGPVDFESYPLDKKLCIVNHYTEYRQRTEKVRLPRCPQLLISFLKPHGPVSTETISRWCKRFLEDAGVNANQFKAHSTRAASPSYLVNRNTDISSILKAVGWSNERTFQTFYNKQLEELHSYKFGSALLQSAGL